MKQESHKFLLGRQSKSLLYTSGVSDRLAFSISLAKGHVTNRATCIPKQEPIATPQVHAQIRAVGFRAIPLGAGGRPSA